MGPCMSVVPADISQLRSAKVRAMWKAAPTDATNQVERLECWAYILDDDNMCKLYGADEAEGREVLEAMKAVKALDVSGDGMVDQEEFFRLLHPGVIATAEMKVALPKKVAALWTAMPLDNHQQIERLKCWDILLNDDELASCIGKSDKKLGKKILAAMKEMKALDTSGDGQIDESEFFRLLREEVMAAAELRVGMQKRVAYLWVSLPLDDQQQIERLTCWDILLKDDDLAILLGKNDLSKGKRMLAAMKESKALDVSGDGQIDKSEFVRLFNPEVMAAAEAKA